MPRRTQREIEIDCKRIQEAAKKATSMKEIATFTGLSQSAIKTSLSKHPRISSRVQKQVEANNAKNEADCQRQKDKTEESVKKSQNVSKPQNVKKQNDTPTSDTQEFEMGIVIDTSMMGVTAICDLISKVCAIGSKIVLTSVVRQELNKMQFYKDKTAMNARIVMSMAAQEPERFQSVKIDETLETPDDCIVKYCADNKDRVVLWTADKDMILKAREYSVKAQYFRKKTNTIENFKYISSKATSTKVSPIDVATLNPATKVGNKLVILEMQGDKRDICVYSNGQKYVDGIVDLKIGDEVFIAAVKKTGYITFVHFRMITLYEENNCRCIYSDKLYNYNDIDKLPDGTYQSFVRDFWNKHGLPK